MKTKKQLLQRIPSQIFSDIYPNYIIYNYMYIYRVETDLILFLINNFLI